MQEIFEGERVGSCCKEVVKVQYSRQVPESCKSHDLGQVCALYFCLQNSAVPAELSVHARGASVGADAFLLPAALRNKLFGHSKQL